MADKKAFLLRLAPDVWEELRRWADDDLRSVNAQVEFVIREGLRRRRRELEQHDASRPPLPPTAQA